MGSNDGEEGSRVGFIVGQSDGVSSNGSIVGVNVSQNTSDPYDDQLSL